MILYTPTLEDLWFRKQFMEDEETMFYNHHWGGTIPFPEELWPDWHDYWVAKALVSRDCVCFVMLQKRTE